MIYGFYVDESGNTGFGDMANQPVVSYGGILVPNEHLVNIEQDFFAISCKIKLEIQNTIQGVSHFDDMSFFKKFEIHSSHFFKGANLFGNLSLEQRLRLAEDMLNLLRQYKVKVFVAAINKSVYKNNQPSSAHIKMHGLCISEMVNLLENELLSTTSTAAVLTDNGRDDEYNLLSNELKNPKRTGVILAQAFKVESYNSPLVQLSDLVIYLTSNYFKNKYGFQNSKNLADFVALYNKALSPISTCWEYS